MATASTPSGTVMWNVNVALSSGWSLAGNHVDAPSGSLSTKLPSSSFIHPTGDGQRLSGDRLGHARVDHLGDELGAGWQRRGRVHDELVAVALEARRLHRVDAGNIEAVEVEVELAERARRRDLGGQGRLRLQMVARRVDDELEVVVLDVVAAVAERRGSRDRPIPAAPPAPARAGRGARAEAPGQRGSPGAGAPAPGGGRAGAPGPGGERKARKGGRDGRPRKGGKKRGTARSEAVRMLSSRPTPQRTVAVGRLRLDVGRRGRVGAGGHRVLGVVDDLDVDAEVVAQRVDERGDRAVALARHRLVLAVDEQLRRHRRARRRPVVISWLSSW